MGKESRYPSDVPVDNLFKPFLERELWKTKLK